MNKTLAPDGLRTSTAGHLALGVLGGMLLGADARDQRARRLLRLAGVALIGAAARPAIERLVRLAGERRQTVAFHSSIELDRSVATVFRFFKDFENFPRVFGGLRSVVDYQDGRSRWESYTPSGEIMTWNVVVTKYVPNHVIGWESVPGSPVEMKALVRFTPLGSTRTRLDFRTATHPVRTGLSDAMRALLGPPQHSRVRRDLEHMRFYLESLPEPVVVVSPPTA